MIIAEQPVIQFMKPFFGFAKNRCATIGDAEDVTQEICIKLYRALIIRNDITNPDKFAWTIAHNVLANYYRSRSRHGISVPIHGFVDILSTDDDFTANIEEAESIERLHREIAYLSKTRRQIVIMHYFENKRQQEIADTLELSLGTVKWHLSESKIELKKGMEIMMTNSELKFNPVKFSGISTNGSAGSRGGNHEYLRSALAQNILYLTRNEAKNKPDNKVTFEEAATIRPDGGVNICCCTMAEPNAEPMKYWESFSKMGGPSWNGDEKFLLWLIDTEWGGNRVGNYHPDYLNRDRASLQTFFESSLGEDDALRMTERGYILRELLENGIRDTLKIVWLNHEENKRLLGIANEIRAKYATELDALKTSYIAADIPEHMRKAAAYGIQHTFLSDGLFIVY